MPARELNFPLSLMFCVRWKRKGRRRREEEEEKEKETRRGGGGKRKIIMISRRIENENG